MVRHDLKAHVKFVHEKAGDSDDIPVFPAKSGSGKGPLFLLRTTTKYYTYVVIMILLF